MGVEVRQALERDFEIQMSMKDVRLLTVNKMRAMTSGSAFKTIASKSESEKSVEEVREVVVLPVIGEQQLVSLNDVRNRQKPLFVVHNVNGTVEPLRSVAANMSCPVFGLQYTATSPSDSIQSLAASYLKTIRRVQPQGPYRLAGYSFGAGVAIDMAVQLEVTNEVEGVVLLDGSHTYVEARTAWHRKRLTVEEGSWEPSAVAQGLCTLAGQYAAIDKVKLMEALQAETSTENQIKLTADAVASSNPSLATDAVARFITCFIALLRMGEQYKLASRLRSDVHLIRAKTTDEVGLVLGDHFNLCDICDGEMSLSWVDGDHESFLQNESAIEVANIITAHFNMTPTR